MGGGVERHPPRCGKYDGDTLVDRVLLEGSRAVGLATEAICANCRRIASSSSEKSSLVLSAS